jgi:hypothetical protein
VATIDSIDEAWFMIPVPLALLLPTMREATSKPLTASQRFSRGDAFSASSISAKSQVRA